MNKIYCGLGSNVGDKINFLNKAIEKLNGKFSALKKISSFYETKPMGDNFAANYINSVAEVETNLSLTEFYNEIKLLEKAIGRSETYRWGPREIDIDILLFNDLIFSNEKLTVPHAGLCQRDFVLIPLLEIAGDILIPGKNKSVAECINNLQNHYILRKI